MDNLKLNEKEIAKLKGKIDDFVTKSTKKSLKEKI